MKRMSLNRNQLKYLVTLAMLIDHIAWAFVPTLSLPGQLMHFIGRLTGPTMAFFLAEGYIHTRDVKRYALRLLLFSLLSWPPFSFFETGHWFFPLFGVIYTLFLGLLAVWLWDRANVHALVKVFAVCLLCFLSLFGDWMVFDVLWPLFFFLWRERPGKKWIAFCLVAALSIALGYLGSGPAWRGLYGLGVYLVPPLLQYCYNGRSGSRRAFHKWFFYAFYPLHLLALGLLKAALH